MRSPPPALGALLQAFRDRDFEVREEARRELVRIGQPAAEALVARIGTSEAAVRALVAMGEAAVPALIARAAAPDHAGLSWKAANLLIRIGESAVGPIIDRLRAGPGFCDAIVYALGEIGSHLSERASDTVVPELIQVLRTGEPHARLMAAIELGKNAVAAQRAAPALVRVLEECGEIPENGDSRGDLRSGLRRQELRRFRERMRDHSVAALVRIGRPAVPALVEVWRAQGKDRPAGASAIRALEGIAARDPSAALHLIGVLDGPEPGRHGELPAAAPAPETGSQSPAAEPESESGERTPVSTNVLRFILFGFVLGLALVVLLFASLVFDLRALLFAPGR